MTTTTQGPLHLQDVNRARNFYNPLRRLDMPRVVTLLEEGERGQYCYLQDLYRMAEKRFSVLKALKSRRLGAIKGLDWKVKQRARLPKGFTPAQAQAQADFLTDAYENLRDFTAALQHLALASFRGYAHLEKRYQDDNPSLPCVSLAVVPQWFWVRGFEDWGWRYDVTARNNNANALPIDPANFVIREVDDPLNEIALVCFVRANMSKKDWDAFCDDYNIPSIFAILGQMTPTDKVKEWLEVMERVTNNSRGALPPGSSIETIEAANADGKQFQSHVEWQEREVVMAGTGGLLTMLTAPGSGTLAGSAHQEAFDLIALAEAMEISEVLQKQFDLPLLQREFPSQPVLAYFQLAAVDEEDLNSLADRLLKLSQAGFEAEAQEIGAKFGLTLAKKTPSPVFVRPGMEAGQPATDGAPPFSNRAAAGDLGAQAKTLLGTAVGQLSGADRQDQAPLIDRLRQIDALDDDDAWLAAMRQLDADWPALLAKVVAAGGKAEVFHRLYGTALVAGAVDSARSDSSPAKAPAGPQGVSTPSSGRQPA